MRELVIEEIIRNFECGLDEFGTAFWKGYPDIHPIYIKYMDWEKRWSSKLKGLCRMREKYCWTSHWFVQQKKSAINDFIPELRELLSELTDKDLIRALSGQVCQDCR